MAPVDRHSDVTRLLQAWQQGDGGALGRLTPLVHAELHRIASRHMAGERVGHTLQSTALVNEAYLRLVDSDVSWESRTHFFALAARMMRRILVDHARARNSAKRGQGQSLLTLNETVLPGEHEVDLLQLEQALIQLETQDPAKGEVLELYIFSGLSLKEIAAMKERSVTSVHRDLTFAKAWLVDALERT